ncbi:MAG: Na+/H+ antiporter subunit E [Luteibaculaceae bacterium]
MRTQFLMNILLTVIWVAVTGSLEGINFLFGFVASFLVLWIINLSAKERKYFVIAPKLISFFFYFIYELFKANLEVAYEVITPKLNMKPGIIKVPLDITSDLEITILANLITLTPGTLSLDVSSDKKVLYVHAMYIHNEQEFIDSIKNGFEKRILEITR